MEAKLQARLAAVEARIGAGHEEIVKVLQDLEGWLITEDDQAGFQEGARRGKLPLEEQLALAKADQKEWESSPNAPRYAGLLADFGSPVARIEMEIRERDGLLADETLKKAVLGRFGARYPQLARNTFAYHAKFQAAKPAL